MDELKLSSGIWHIHLALSLRYFKNNLYLVVQHTEKA